MKFIEKIKNIFLKKNKEEDNDSFIKSAIIALVLALLFRSFLYEPFHIPSGSMKPTLIEGDFIIVSKFKYGYSRYSFPLFGLPIIKQRLFDFNKPQRGDIIVFRLPRNSKINYIKRLIGLPNDKVIIKNDIVYVNGKELKRKFNDEYYDEKNKINLMEYTENINNKNIYILQKKQKLKNDIELEFIVPEGHYFFLGDNRDDSLDSRFRETGFVPYKNIVGKADIIFFSKNDSLFKIWKLHKIIRFKRIFKILK